VGLFASAAPPTAPFGIMFDIDAYPDPILKQQFRGTKGGSEALSFIAFIRGRV
jgi:hypothetical protein